MRLWIILGPIAIGLFLFIFTGLYIIPHYYYHKVVNKNYQSSWYRLERYSSVLLQTKKDVVVDTKSVENENLWQKFHFATVNIPLPVKNPFFFVVPELFYNKDSKKTKYGVSILTAEDTKIFEIYFMPKMIFPNYLTSQKIFSLPLVENIIRKKTSQQIWRDVLTKDIDSWNISYREMLYNLYVLQFRSKIFQDSIKHFGKVKDRDMGIIEVDYPDRDYIAELIMELRGDSLYSYIIVTRKENQEALLIRNKYIKETEYIESTPSLQDILVREFKSLSYNEQVDHEGMLYLSSALSHNAGNEELLKKIIFFLERGYKNNKQLEPFYRYAYNRFNKIYSKKHIKNLNLSSEIILKRNIELEDNLIELKKNNELKEELPPEPQVSIEEEYDALIESTGKKQKNNNTIRID